MDRVLSPESLQAIALARQLQPFGADLVAVHVDIGGGEEVLREALFGDYQLIIPRPCVVLAGDLKPSHPTAWGIHDAYRVRGILRVQADQFTVQQALTKRVRIEAVQTESRTLEQVDGATLVRRM